MKRFPILAILETVSRIGLGALFLYSAVAKINDPGVFADSVERYQMLPGFLLGIFALTMPMLELLAGLALLFTKWQREASLLISFMLTMFIIALTQALVRGLEISCGCFGVPSVGGREEILIALIRDVILIVPSIWLTRRANVWLWPLGRLPKRWRLLGVYGGGLALATLFLADLVVSGNLSLHFTETARGETEARRLGLFVSRGSIRPGEWNADFEGVLEKAEREQRPMVLLVVGKGCTHCARLEKCISGEAFRLWREDRAPLMAFIRDTGATNSAGVVKKAVDFIHEIEKNLKEYPYVGVYCPQPGATNQVAFCGRRGLMGRKKDKLLSVEFMSALDRALDIHPGTGSKHKTLRSIVTAATKRVSVKAEGDGTVAMFPASGVLPEGKTVELKATARSGSAFVDWRRPDGSRAGWSYRLDIDGGMADGCYVARFRKRSDCIPPIVLSPAETTLCVHFLNRFRHAVRVDETSRPVRFRTKTPLPRGWALHPETGVLTGAIIDTGTNVVEIAIVGNDLKETTKNVNVTIIALPNDNGSHDARSSSQDSNSPQDSDSPQDSKK